MENDSISFWFIDHSFHSALTIAFIVLKLCGVIAWPWFFIFIPVIATAAIGIVLAVATGILSALCGDD